MKQRDLLRWHRRPAAPILVERLETRTHLSVGDIDASFNHGRSVATNDLGAAHETVLVDDGDKILFDTASHLYRLNEDGSPDTSFGINGVAADAGFGPVDVQFAPGGKIVIAGTLNHQFAVARYNDDGSLDTTFGAGGIATAAPTANHQLTADDLVVQTDGKVVVGGASIDPSINVDADPGDYSHDELIRFNADGTVDTAYGTNGLFDAGGVQQLPTSMAILPDDSVYLATSGLSLGQEGFGGAALVAPDGRSSAPAGQTSGLGTPTFDYPVVTDDGRLFVYNGGLYTDDLEARYGSSPVETLDLGNETGVGSLTATSDGKLLTVISSPTFGGEYAIARYNPDLTRDPTFAPGGFVLTSIGRTGAVINGRGALLPDGDLILPSGNPYDSKVQLTAVRVTSDTTGLDEGPQVTGLTVAPPTIGSTALYATVTLSPNGSPINPSSIADGGLWTSIPAAFDYGHIETAQGTLVSVAGRHFTKYATYKFTLPAAFTRAMNGNYTFVFLANGVRNAVRLANAGGVIGAVTLYAPPHNRGTSVVTTAVPVDTDLIDYGPATAATGAVAEDKKRVFDDDR